ncbi:hypothetical protein LHFGNBLO_002385 [Mesorhizobium sp. AR10]|uniref:N,N-dimethylformamidase beta subunit family domain-containing protein n=1 Tax=Mesorhizobium sp. AR10 TaxID=2865839 RepID=UPI00215E0AF1|nr:N,N-dimethylformamidase beta subunit family domain-containing protein [Mesorhizobium sp. AR10]UVK40857.1 hypothetical protein LHFGNBLO_002385 [Mesorhizobium sp. AR10]
MLNSHNPLPAVIGYVTPLSAKAGEILQFKISSAGNRDVAANVFRLDCCDPNPAGPGVKRERVEFGLERRYRAVEQRAHLGSCAIGPFPKRPEIQGLVISLVVQPRLSSASSQTIFSLQNSDGSKGLALVLVDGNLFLKALRKPQVTIDLKLDLRLNEWTKLNVTFYENGVSARRSVIHTRENSEVAVAAHDVLNVLREVDHTCFAATWIGHPEDCFNGSIEAPVVSDASGDVLASWTLANTIGREWVEDNVDRSRRLTLINMPMRAVRSSSWTGRDMDWKVAPQDYAAITFHSDDLSDCKWETTIAIEVPAEVPSGVYGLLVDNGVGTDIIPFYVLRNPELPRQRILFLAPTFTYMAYANHARGNFSGALEARVKEWNAFPHNPDNIGAFGCSTYNRHPDGSGVTLSSRLRPIMTMRPQYLTYFDANGSGMRHFSADSHLTDWLRVKGFSFDVLTDEDLDRDGADACPGMMWSSRGRIRSTTPVRHLMRSSPTGREAAS